jgi:uncharacterized membrane protein YdjX (TVP38/TMEM64 family)
LKEELIQLFQQHPGLAVILSICISIIVAVLGVVPSVFITAANIIFFGFWEGVFISFLGEAIGALAAFYLYRKGFKKIASEKLQQFPRLQRLVEAEGREAFLLIFSLRLLPFVPSGLVSFAAAVGRVSGLIFLIASSLGKIPALLLEGYSVLEVSRFGWQGKLILFLTAIILLWTLLKQHKNRKSQ